MDYIELCDDTYKLTVGGDYRQSTDLVQIEQVHSVAEARLGRSRDDVYLHQLEDLHICDPKPTLPRLEACDSFYSLRQNSSVLNCLSSFPGTHGEATCK